MTDAGAVVLSRRKWLLAAATLGACRAGSRETASERRPVAGAAPPSEAPELAFVQVGEMAESERGGTAVVLLHGWGAPGDDLVPLAKRLARPRSRFFLPAALLARPPAGRAWWPLDGRTRPPHATEARVPDGSQPRPEVLRARHAVQQLLRDVRRRYAPERLVLGGFSQGAMLSLDVALAQQPGVDRVAALSGVLLADSIPSLLALAQPYPSLLVTHGRADRVLPFEGGETAARLLSERGLPVTFQAFDGGHQIPPEVVAALTRLIYD